MKKNKNIRKTLAITVILLFIGLAFAPSINANVGKESELVEFTTEVCGLNGGEQTVKLTQEEAEEVEALFDSIRERLNETETRDEAEKIFEQAVVELDKYGLLGGLSIKQAQRLVTGGYQDSRVMNALEKMGNRREYIFNSNFLCLISGQTELPSVSFQGPLARNAYKLFLLFFALTFLFGAGLGLENFGLFWQYLAALSIIFIYFPCHMFGEFNPTPIGYTIGIGGYVSEGFFIPGKPAYFVPAEGWISTIGLTGIKESSGKFYGCLPLFPNMFYIVLPFLPGVTGFTGIKYTNFDNDVAFFLGFALWVRIDDEPPNFPWYS